MKRKMYIEAIPPEDYKGSISEWMAQLQERGLWNGQNPEWYGDIMIPNDTWWDILEWCEK